MTIETDTERQAMIRDFGQSVTYTPSGGPSKEVTVLFDHAYLGVDATGGVLVESVHPTVLALTSDVPTAGHGESLVIGPELYYIVGVQADGLGMTQLILEING
jgi:hypothetical protein